MRRSNRDLGIGGLGLGILPGLVLIFACIGFADEAFSAVEKQRLRLTVRVYNHAHVTAAELTRAEDEAARILRRAGIEIAWMDCPLSEAEVETYPACKRPPGPTDLFLKIVPRSMAQRYGFSPTAMGFALLSSKGNGGSETFVFHHWVERLAELQQASRPTILGHAMAHEIGHLLLGTNSHFPIGIMRADWSRKDLRSASRGDFGFTAKQCKLIRAAVLARAEAQGTTEAAKLGSPS